MELALHEATIAESTGEVPVGAVIVHTSHGIITTQHNLVEARNDPTAHAELLAIQTACKLLHTRYLEDCTLYCTLEPCAMCTQAIMLSRLRKLIFGAVNEKAGAVESVLCLLHHKISNSTLEVYGGIMADQTSTLMQRFFTKLRNN